MLLLRAQKAEAEIERLRDQNRNLDGMAACMDMVRQELIEAGVITEKVPPMFVSTAVLSVIAAKNAEIASLREAAESAGNDKRDAERFRATLPRVRMMMDVHGAAFYVR